MQDPSIGQSIKLQNQMMISDTKAMAAGAYTRPLISST
jgi:hypothetical protein